MDRKREKALIRAAQRGDNRAFAALYRDNVDKIYRYVYYRVESAATAEDLTSDVFLRFIEGLPNYEDRSTPLLVWLYRIAHARVVDYYRRSKRSAHDEDIESLELSAEEDLDAGLVAGHRTSHLQAALRSLTDGQRQVIVLRFVEGHNLERTAQILGKTVDAIKAMQYRALQALGQTLNRQGFKPDE